MTRIVQGIHMIDEKQAQAAVRTLLEYIGEDPDREGLIDTPRRFIKAWRNDFFTGYEQDAGDVLKTTFDEVGGYAQPVVLRDIKFYSYCEHHIVPIIGTVSIAYLPKNRVVGISKLARLVEVYARRLQIQERMTVQICDALQEHLQPQGVAVLIRAEHLCMSSRGVRIASTLETSAFSGVYEDNNEAGLRVLSL